MDAKRLNKLLDQQGFERRFTGSGHIAIYKDGRLVSSMANTPRGGRRSDRNALAYLRKAGLRVPR